MDAAPKPLLVMTVGELSRRGSDNDAAEERVWAAVYSNNSQGSSGKVP
jgi:hypothetical protein